ncbi:hypothetical protein [Paracidovorax anthurii]|uniref:Uncharacterized protein n=1 Tax=Paracidovorax anthurii TaxID=78229 RepID=A0A328Z4K2_9BURK|nr:hypothetical protein [Paracidovorax anthurii]RAR80988.1 hypothetical protein AX018_10214 [Paracidovorax anthurii]
MDEIFHMETIYGASKNVEYKKQVLQKCTAIFLFFKSNGLIKFDPLDSDGIVKKDLVVLADDLTAAGLVVWKEAFAKWSKARDKDNNYQNMKMFEVALQKAKEN